MSTFVTEAQWSERFQDNVDTGVDIGVSLTRLRLLSVGDLESSIKKQCRLAKAWGFFKRQEKCPFHDGRSHRLFSLFGGHLCWMSWDGELFSVFCVEILWHCIARANGTWRSGRTKTHDHFIFCFMWYSATRHYQRKAEHHIFPAISWGRTFFGCCICAITPYCLLVAYR